MVVASRRTSFIVAAAVGLTASLGFAAAPASAAPDPALVKERQACEAQLAKRFQDVDRFVAQYQASPSLAKAHRTVLDSNFARTRATFGKIRQAASKAQTLAELKSVCDQIVPSERLYDLREVQVSLAVANAPLVVEQGQLVALHIKLAAALKKQPAATRRTLQPKLQKLQDAIFTAGEAQRGLITKVIAVTPAQWNDNHEILVPLSNRSTKASEHLKVARSLAAELRSSLKL
jgi:hypothetical protein